jgi:hypothetical protein
MILDKLLFKPKHWQMFTITLALTLVNAWFLARNSGAGPMIGDCLSGIVIATWFMLLGSRLKKRLPTYYATHYAVFMMIGFSLMIALVLATIYREEFVRFLTPFVRTWEGFILFIPVLAIVSVFLGFIARAMKSLQTNDRATVADYGNDVFLWLMWWIGVWFLQPRLNRLYERFYSQS